MADDTPEPKHAAVHAPTEPALQSPTASPAAEDSSPLKRVTLVAVNAATSPGPRRARDIESYVGYIIDGRYQIESVIAEGGMGMVYLARHRLLEKPVAVKILRPELVHDRDITRRFLTEAQAASAVGNEHIVDVTDFGELPDGATYIVMEYLDGQSLGQLLQANHGSLPVDLVLHIARQIAEGLQRAHDANIIHRDLKPDNIQLVERNKQSHFVKILDFGIAKVASSQNETTRAGKIFGTPYYMSPEQAKGELLDRRTDVYALGVILFEMLTGRVPFEGENPLGILTQHMYVEPPPLGEVSGVASLRTGLEAVVGRCLLKEPSLRYESMAELDEDLARLQAGEEPLAVRYLLHTPGVPDTLLAALRDAYPKRTRGGWSRCWGAAGVLTRAAGAAALALNGKTDWWRLASGAAAVATTSTAAPTAPPSNGSTPAPIERYRTVALVVSPIDAHVFQGERDLGMMPINVRIREGQRVELTVRRPNYRSRSVIVDGNESRIVVQLSPLPGRSGPTLEGGGATSAAPPPLARDAGAQPRSAGSADVLTGAAPHGPLPIGSNAPMRGPIIDLSDVQSPPPPGPPPREEPLHPGKSLRLPPPPPTPAPGAEAAPPGPKPVEPIAADATQDATRPPSPPTTTTSPAPSESG